MTQFTISCAVELLRLVTSDDIMMSLLKMLSISIKIYVVKPLLNRRPNSSAVVVTRELVANSVHTADSDATVESRRCRRCVLGIRPNR